MALTARSFVYKTLIGYPGVTSLVGGMTNPRVWAKKTLTSSIEECPYIVYKLGNDTSEPLAETEPMTRQFFQVWVHDFHDAEVGDYEKIDEIIKQVGRAFYLRNSAPDGIFATEFLETSQDLNDETLNTLFRYSRFNLIRKAPQ
jgi:hypothetical protein